MKTASWLLTLFLAGLLVYSFARVPATDSLRSLHVSSRYEQRAEMETGIRSQAGAILADYRSTDLLVTALLLSTAAFCIFFFFNHPPRMGDVVPALLLLALGGFLTLGTGFLCLLHGGNFLDYEGLVAWTGPLHAHVDGALALLGGTLLAFGGLLMLALRWWRTPGGSGGR